MEPMSQEEYKESRGVKCPDCHSDEVDGGGFHEAKDQVVFRERICDDCGNLWWDLYTLTGYDKTEPQPPSNPSARFP